MRPSSPQETRSPSQSPDDGSPGSSLDESVKVFLDELPWDVRPYNTDGTYVRSDLPQLSRFEPGLTFIAQRSQWLSFRENANIIRAALARRIGHPQDVQQELTSRLSRTELDRSGAQVVFSHRAFPLNAGAVPIVWQQAILDPVMQSAYGVSEAALTEERDVKGALFRRCAMVQVSTKVESRRHAMMFPDIADRFVDVAFFSPRIAPGSRDALQRHFDKGPVRLLFVGRQAWRKGLDLVLEAFDSLPDSLKSMTTLTVISNFHRSPIRLPHHPQISVVRDANPSQVLEEMKRSHIFLNPARFESYGLVFHEAMSQGLACIAPDWEVQRELFDEGRAGMLVAPEPKAIQRAIEALIGDQNLRFKLGEAAWERFGTHYHPAIVARRYAEIFRRAAAAR